MPNSSVSRKTLDSQTGSRTRRLAFERLEKRDLMAGIPQLNSLAGAARTIYLDFDGHFQSVWNRTDSNQTYTNVNVGEFNIDNTAGISATEEAAIRKIWETVADDFSPFNVNVTTVAPSSFANGVALRIVMAGTSSATLRNSAGTTMNIPTRDVFISNDNGTMVDTSGYAAIGSFSNAEPNVVYVFAKYMSSWGTTDSEGRYRDLRNIVATTASHEAGHAFGLVHHGDYDVGTNITTPIMGSNTQGDRSIWSVYTSGNTTFDSRARLTSLLGSRPDEFASSLHAASEFPIGYNPIRGYTGTVKGVIGTTIDTDLFRLTTNASKTYTMTVSVPQFGNLDSQLVIYMVRGGSPWGYEYLEQVFVVDPSIPASAPFSGLGVTATFSLPAGKWAIGVRSHGGYGDIGGYALTVSIPNSGIVYNPGTVGASRTTWSQPNTVYTTQTATAGTTSGGASVGPSAPASFLAQPAAMETASLETSRKKAKVEAIDELFGAWSSHLGAF